MRAASNDIGLVDSGEVDQSALPRPRGNRDSKIPVRPPVTGADDADEDAAATEETTTVDADAGTPCVESSHTGADVVAAAAVETTVVEAGAGAPCVESSQTGVVADATAEETTALEVAIAAADEMATGFCAAQALFFRRTFRWVPFPFGSSRLNPAEPCIAAASCGGMPKCALG